MFSACRLCKHDIVGDVYAPKQEITGITAQKYAVLAQIVAGSVHAGADDDGAAVVGRWFGRSRAASSARERVGGGLTPALSCVRSPQPLFLENPCALVKS
jgi:hypothetical protein